MSWVAHLLEFRNSTRVADEPRRVARVIRGHTYILPFLGEVGDTVRKSCQRQLKASNVMVDANVRAPIVLGPSRYLRRPRWHELVRYPQVPSRCLGHPRHGPPAVQFILKAPPARCARATGRRKRAMPLTASARLAGAFTSLPFRTKARHWVFATSLSENSVDKATGSAFTAVRRFTNVAFTAWANVGPSKSNCREKPDVVEILHPAVQRAELDHRLELFRDRGFAGVTLEAWRREVEQGGVRDLHRPGHHHVADTNVELHGDPGPREEAVEANPHTLVVRVLPDPFGLHRRGSENEAIRLDVDGANLAHHRRQILQGVLEPAKKIDVLRGPGHWRVPDTEHERPLQDEARGVRRLRQAI